MYCRFNTANSSEETYCNLNIFKYLGIVNIYKNSKILMQLGYGHLSLTWSTMFAKYTFIKMKKSLGLPKKSWALGYCLTHKIAIKTFEVCVCNETKCVRYFTPVCFMKDFHLKWSEFILTQCSASLLALDGFLQRKCLICFFHMYNFRWCK